MRRLLPIGMCFLLLIGCSSWNQVGHTDGYRFRGITVDIPPNWMQLDHPRYLLLSKDGPFLQYILVQQFPVDRAFQNTKKRFREGMLPQEAARVIIDDMASDPGLCNFQLIRSEPAVLDSLDGFRLLFTYENPQGLIYKTLYYGFIAGCTYYSIRYNAAQRHYYEKDLDTFEQTLGSFRILADPAA